MSRLHLLLPTIVVLAACGGGGGSPKPAAAPTSPSVTLAPSTPTIATPSAPVVPSLPPVPSSPVAAPDGLIATGSSPAVTALLPAVAAYAEQVQPGAGQAATVETLTALAQQAGFYLRGVRLDRPVRLLALDPGRIGSSLVVVVEVADEEAVRALADRLGVVAQFHRGFAALGERPAVEAAGGYALTTLLTQPVAAVPTLSLDMAYLVEHYHDDVEAGIAATVRSSPPAQRAMVESMLSLYVELFVQVERLELSLSLDGGRASLVTRLHPVTGGGLARFIAAQHPATFAQLGRLPGGSIAVAGDLELGKLWEAMAPLMGPMMAGVYGGPVAELQANLLDWAKLDLGEFAMTGELATPGMEFTGLLEVGDPGQLVSMWTAQEKAMATALAGKFDYRTTSTNYRGTKLMTTVTTPGKDLSPEQRAAFAALGAANRGVFGVARKRAIYTFGERALERAKAMVDALAGGKPVTARASAFAPEADEAARRRESAFMAFDVATMITRFGVGGVPIAPPRSAAPAVVGLGADAGALTLRVTMPASQVAALMGAQQVGAPGADEAIRQMGEFTDELCACPDLACAEGVMKQMSAMKDPGGKPTKAQMERAMALAERMAGCQKRLMSTTP